MTSLKNGIITLSALLSLSSCSEPNTIKLTLGHGIKISRFRIEVKTIDSTVKKVQFRRDSVFYIPDSHGENDWRFIYNDSIELAFRHIKTNRNDHHAYTFMVYEKDSVMMADIAIRGVAKFDTTMAFTPIKR
jgi:hypothetical protein